MLYVCWFCHFLVWKGKEDQSKQESGNVIWNSQKVRSWSVKSFLTVYLLCGWWVWIQSPFPSPVCEWNATVAKERGISFQHQPPGWQSGEPLTLWGIGVCHQKGEKHSHVCVGGEGCFESQSVCSVLWVCSSMCTFPQIFWMWNFILRLLKSLWGKCSLIPNNCEIYFRKHQWKNKNREFMTQISYCLLPLVF